MLTYEAVALYLQDPGSNMKSDSTRKGRRELLRRMGGTKIVNSWCEADLVDFITGLAVADSTKDKYRNDIMSFFSWCHWKGHTKHDPAVHLRRAIGLNPQPVVVNNWLSEADVAALLARTPSDTLHARRDHLLFRLGFTTALRASELSSLTWGNVDLAESTIWLPRGKGGKPSEIFVTPHTRVHLADWRGLAAGGLGREPGVGDPVLVQFKAFAKGGKMGTITVVPRWEEAMSYWSIRDRCMKVSDLTGIKFRPHDMRRTYGGLMEAKGFHVDDIKKAMRHSSSVTTEKYLQTRRSDARRAQAESGIDF